ncbi:MAG: hypothetical protein HY815_30125 [Candidatus Riflebacteria bacterium]|nr:hypothetical protein [Candidatus Riflebacteria bacterium]
MEDLLPRLAGYYAQCRKVLVSGRTNRELAQVRAEFQGVFRRDEYTDNFPKVAFRSGGLDAVLAVWPKKSDFSTFQINLVLSNPATGSSVLPYPPLEMFSHALADSVLTSRDLHKIGLGDSFVDHHFTLLVRDEYPVRKLMGKETRETLTRLYYLPPQYNLYLGLEYERALVKKLVRAEELTASLLKEMSELTRALVEGLIKRLLVEEADQELVKILTVSLPEEQARCQVCGERIGLDKIECRRCETPHHRDCWEYNGRCSMYACGETRYRVPL